MGKRRHKSKLKLTYADKISFILLGALSFIASAYGIETAVMKYQSHQHGIVESIDMDHHLIKLTGGRKNTFLWNESTQFAFANHIGKAPELRGGLSVCLRYRDTLFFTPLVLKVEEVVEGSSDNSGK